MASVSAEGSAAVATTFWLRLTGLIGKLTSIPRVLISKLQPHPHPLLPLTNHDSTLHLITQNLQKLELGKLFFTLATTATLGLLFANKPEDQASSTHCLIIVGFMVSCTLLYNGIIVFGVINPRLGNFLELIGVTLIFSLFCVLVGTFLPVGFSLACWVCAAFSLMSFLSILIKPHPDHPYLQRFQAADHRS